MTEEASARGTKKMNKTEARRIARLRSAQLRADREEASRKAREEADRIQRERDEANEIDLVEFFQLDAALDAARDAFEALKEDHEDRKNAAIARMFDREKKAKVVADLVGLPTARVSAMRRAHAAATHGDAEESRAGEIPSDAETSEIAAEQSTTPPLVDVMPSVPSGNVLGATE